jgi:hypothetical protein
VESIPVMGAMILTQGKSLALSVRPIFKFLVCVMLKIGLDNTNKIRMKVRVVNGLQAVDFSGRQDMLKVASIFSSIY